MSTEANDRLIVATQVIFGPSLCLDKDIRQSAVLAGGRTTQAGQTDQVHAELPGLWPGLRLGFVRFHGLLKTYTSMISGLPWYQVVRRSWKGIVQLTELIGINC